MCDVESPLLGEAAHIPVLKMPNEHIKAPCPESILRLRQGPFPSVLALGPRQPAG